MVTDLGVYHFDDDGEMRLDSLHPGPRSTTCAQPWAGRCGSRRSSAETPPPSREELRLMREVLDPEGRYTALSRRGPPQQAALPDQ